MNDGSETEGFGPFVLVIDDLSENIDAKAILYTTMGAFRFLIPSSSCKKQKEMIAHIRQVRPELTGCKFIPVHSYSPTT